MAGHIYKAAAAHFGAVGDGRQDIVARELRILFAHLIVGHAGGEEVEDQRDPKASAADTGFAEVDVAIDRSGLREDSWAPEYLFGQDTSNSSEESEADAPPLAEPLAQAGFF